MGTRLKWSGFSKFCKLEIPGKARKSPYRTFQKPGISGICPGKSHNESDLEKSCNVNGSGDSEFSELSRKNPDLEFLKPEKAGNFPEIPITSLIEEKTVALIGQRFGTRKRKALKTMTMETTLNASIPPRRYLSREEAAAWLGVSIDTFSGFSIPYCDFGPRLRRWDIVDIEAYANDNKSRDSVRTSQPSDKRSGRQCSSTNVKARRNGGPHGTTRTESEIAEVLGLLNGS
jgi:hypothetical protein